MNKERRIPQFICVGAPKAGTTYLYDLLRNHRDVYLSDKKEVHFFSRDSNFNQGAEWYLNHFQDAGESSIIGEISPSYLFHPKAAERIWSVLGGDCKIIIMLRDPVDRAFSHYNMFRSRNIPVKSNFLDEIEAEEIDTFGKYALLEGNHRNFISKSLYNSQVERYMKVFPEKQILIILFEELKRENTSELQKKLFAFLEVSESEVRIPENDNKTYVPKKWKTHTRIIKMRKYIDVTKKILPKSLYVKMKNAVLSLLGSRPEKLSQEIRIDLIDKYFIDDICKLESTLNIDLTHWKHV